MKRNENHIFTHYIDIAETKEANVRQMKAEVLMASIRAARTWIAGLGAKGDATAPVQAAE